MPEINDDEYAEYQLLKIENKRLQDDLIHTYEETVSSVSKFLRRRGYLVASEVALSLVGPDQHELEF